MKEKKETEYETNLEEQINRLKEKNKTQIAHLEVIKELKTNKIKEVSRMQEDRTKLLKEKLAVFNRTNEINRINVKINLEKTLNNFFQKNKENLEKKKQAIQEKNIVILDKFHTNYENIQTEKLIELEKNKQRPVDKFEKWVNYY